MDETDQKAEIASPDIPKLPIKTYRWEDVRRSRKRGRYPWTHLTKPPFGEELDPEEYTMDAFRRSRSTSTLGKSETQEIAEIDNMESTEKLDSCSNDDELSQEKENIDAPNMQEAGTSIEQIEVRLHTQSNVDRDRAKSEEPKKKRKLSVDSSYSRMSLPKLRLMEKFKNAKSKFKVPKLPKRSRPEVMKQKTASPIPIKEKTQKMQTAKNQSPVYIHIPLKPPPGETDEFSKLEFESSNHSPSGSLTNVTQTSERKRKTSLLDILTQIKLVHDQHVARRLSQTSDDINRTTKQKSDSESDLQIRELRADEHQPQIKEEDEENGQQPTIEIEESGSTARTAIEDSLQSDKLTIEEILDEDDSKSTEDNKAELVRLTKPQTPEPARLDVEDSSVDDNISQCLDKDDKCEFREEADSSTHLTESATNSMQEIKDLQRQHLPDPEKLLKLEATLSKWKKQVPKATNLEIPTKETVPVRARSEEPKRKRKSSIDSSHSRKSLSKLTFIKKIKQAKDKIKLPNFPSFSKFDKKGTKKVDEKKTAAPKPLEKQKAAKIAQLPEKPVYIHIPLKLPPGKTDEFSHLSSQPVAEVKPVEESKPEVDEDADPETPEAESGKSKVQLIILTPPSDDEILDSAGPETPCETDQKFFENLKIDDLKTLAKNAVDAVYPDSTQLETVTEDDDSQDGSVVVEQGGNSTLDSPIQKPQQMLVDEEDGLKLSDAAIAMINEELEKEYNQQVLGLKSIIKSECSPILKKKVSFKRKSRAQDGERIYEDVQLNKTPVKGEVDENAQRVVIPLESFQSMSVDEEKSYLDKQIIKTTSLEDDYNKWSKSNDHEYEPINPPPEVITIRGPTVIHDGSSSLERNVNIHKNELIAHDDDKKPKPTAEEIQKDIEDRFLRQTPEKINKKHDKGSSTLQETGFGKESPKIKRKRESTKSFNDAIRTQADKIKTKIQGIKRPNITLPQRPKFPTAKLKKPNFKKPDFKLPKLPERPSINLPSFSFKRKGSKDAWRERQFSTESNAGDSKIKIFDFRTYPRMFDKSKRKESDMSSENREPSPPPPEFATVPRVHKAKAGSRWIDTLKDISHKKENVQSEVPQHVSTLDTIRIPLHPEDVEEEEPIDLPSNLDEEEFEHETRDNDSPFGKDFLRKWDRGEFHAGPQDARYSGDMHVNDYRPDHEPEEIQTPREGSMEITPPKEHSSESLSDHRRGVLEEIDSDEFFLREKGISQEDIEVGKYLSSEIREAFRNPIVLSQPRGEDREYDLELSDQSEPIREVPRRKPLRKPKRKKTPHVSKEQISFDRESCNTEPEEYPKVFREIEQMTPPTRPKRRSNSRRKKKSPIGDVIPYQETIPIGDQLNSFIHPDYTMAMENSEILHDNILSNNMQFFYENGFPQMYENEHMKGIEQPEIKVSDPYYRYENFHSMPYIEDRAPIPPTRRQRSLRSLSASDQDSIAEEVQLRKNVPIQSFQVEACQAEREYIIPTPEPPMRPRRKRSRTRSHSASQQEDDRTSREAESLISDNQVEVVEVIEAPCIKDIRDASGYAIIDKSKPRDPPLPPARFPKTPPRTRRAKKTRSRTNDKFATVPRPSSQSDPPMRPLRNYSTLRGMSAHLSGDEKENLNISAGHLQSGEVIQKMRDRPLPAPPRPPRKVRSALRDISHERNLPNNSQENVDKLDRIATDELLDLEQEILPYDHEETVTHGSLVLETLNDPNFFSHSAFTLSDSEKSTARIIPITHEHDADETTEIETQTISPDINVTHEIEVSTREDASDHELSEIPNEFMHLKNPTQLNENDGVVEDEETSEIPEEFKQLKSPLQATEQARFDEDSEIPQEFFQLQSPPLTTDSVLKSKCEEMVEAPEDFSKLKSSKTQEKPVRKVPPQNVEVLYDGQEINILKAQKLQVADLDVDTLRVNELQANKIIVSELDGISLQVSEINSKCGNLILSGIDLPPNLIQEMLHKLQMATEEHASSSNVQREATPVLDIKATSADMVEEDDESTEAGQKKTSIEDQLLEIEAYDQAPPIPPRHDSKTNLLEGQIEIEAEIEEISSSLEQKVSEELLEPPVRPPRRSSQAEKLNGNAEESTVIQTSPDLAEDSYDNSKNVEAVEETRTEELLHSQSENVSKSEEEPPPRPPEPNSNEYAYLPSQPPPSFHALRSPHFKEFIDENIPLPPRRKRHHKPPPISRSSSNDSSPITRRQHRSPEPSIPQLTGQLVRLCASETESVIKRLIIHITNNVLQNADGKQDLHVIILMLLILIAGLILLSDPKVTIHQNHWDFFNPPTDL